MMYTCRSKICVAIGVTGAWRLYSFAACASAGTSATTSAAVPAIFFGSGCADFIAPLAIAPLRFMLPSMNSSVASAPAPLELSRRQQAPEIPGDDRPLAGGQLVAERHALPGEPQLEARRVIEGVLFQRGIREHHPRPECRESEREAE